PGVAPHSTSRWQRRKPIIPLPTTTSVCSSPAFPSMHTPPVRMELVHAPDVIGEREWSRQPKSAGKGTNEGERDGVLRARRTAEVSRLRSPRSGGGRRGVAELAQVELDEAIVGGEPQRLLPGAARLVAAAGAQGAEALVDEPRHLRAKRRGRRALFAG